MNAIARPQLSVFNSQLVLSLCSIAALVVLLTARLLGPSDLWDQTQPKTVSYTTDIIIHGGSHWILPIERGELPATKPPLYNWLAVPMVKWLGFNNEVAHRFPSIVSIMLCWLITVRLGRALDPNGSLGWLAGLALVCSASMFKLGYLARPDMLLTLWLLLGWIAATVLLMKRDGLSTAKRRWIVVGFWSCVTLAALTKGPPAAVLPIYGVAAARFIGGSWRSAKLLKLGWGIPLSLAAFGLWVYGVWRIDPDHLWHKLWFNELYGRVTGLGPEGNRHGPIGFFEDMPEQAAYFVVRFLPWSIPAIAAIWNVLRRRREMSGQPWLVASTIQVLVIVGLFTLSTGKRADYIAGAFPPGAILAAWWLVRRCPLIAERAPWLVPAAAGVTMAMLIVANGHEWSVAPTVRGIAFGNQIRRFIDESAAILAQDPMPLVFCWSGETNVQAMLGSSMKDGYDAVFQSISAGKPFWLIAGRKTSEPHEFAQWLSTRRPKVRVESLIISAQLPRDQGWPEQMTLYRVTP
jgi:4-amino-4-deoxy-L-arabinose transferase-like glycosyltransferase